MTYVAYVLIGLGTLWVALVVASRIIHARLLGRPGILDFDRRLAPYSTTTAATAAANERRWALERFLRQFGAEGPVYGEFLETPPDLRIPQEARYTIENGWVEFWRAARLRLQLDHDESLLIARVTDALISFHRSGELPESEFPQAVQLEPLRRTRGDLFPWRAVIVTGYPERLKEVFQRFPGLVTWLGIGVDVRRIARRDGREGEPQPQGRCINGSDGMEGTVGGHIYSGTDYPWGVTCLHVLSTTCHSVRWPSDVTLVRPQEFIAEAPDVAFIRGDVPCFGNRFDSEDKVQPGTQADLYHAARKETKVRKTSGDHINGIVQSAKTEGFRLGAHFYIGPHFIVIPDFVTQFGITRPLFKRFSKEGDSGAWIIDIEGRQWLGMVIGGWTGRNTQTFALASEYVLEAYRLYHRSRNDVSCHTFVEV